jgi:hypothetical protein
MRRAVCGEVRDEHGAVVRPDEAVNHSRGYLAPTPAGARVARRIRAGAARIHDVAAALESQLN